ncbi:PucR family transcriptional regulator [Streptomyces sp. NRRL F-5126]|uniref:PucR family transcriptional regulator n=1 Tax=Streptomyces sp. NRRL F-5126 TaxID=1463857 RepID=UPI00131D9203|nr:helix-turn-helix domain-containing protein [Streptomyces sp. NRRL F-5126]
MSTVDELLRGVGARRLRLRTAGSGDREISGPVFVHGDPVVVENGPDGKGSCRGGIALLIGAVPHGPAARAAVAALTTAGAAAAVIRTSPEREHASAALTRDCDEAGVALLELTEDVPWLEIAGQIRDVLATTAGTPRWGTVALGGAADLSALADMIAATVGGAVAIEDQHERVLAYSSLAGQPTDEVRRSSILGRKVPDLPYNPNSYERLLRSSSVVRFAGVAPTLLPRLAVAVRAEGELLGSLWAIDAEGALSAGARDALQRAANLTAVHLVRARQARDAEQRHRTRALVDMLGGTMSPQACRAQLGAGPSATAAVVGFGVEDPECSPLSAPARLAQAVQSYFEVHHHSALCGVVDDRAYAVLAEPRPGGELTGLIRWTSANASVALGVAVRAGIGHGDGGWTTLPRARRDADRALRAVSADPSSGPVATCADVADLVVLQELAAEPNEVLAAPVPAVAAMLDHDRRFGTHYARTVHAVLAHGPGGGSAASLLMVHPTTLRYRLRRAEELFGLDLDDPDARLVTWLQLRLRDTSP